VIGRLPSLARVFVACVSAAAWFSISNHCVLTDWIGTQVAAAETAHAHCADHQQPDEDGEQKPALECCKTLAATALGAAKNHVGYKTGDFLPYRHSAARLCLLKLEHRASILELDTGPPGALSFAESVLQRSVLAHAPPSLA